MIIRILAIGDVVNERGVKYLSHGTKLRNTVKALGVDIVIANGENSAKGNGMTVASANALFDCGVDIITGGNHTWQKNEIYNMLDDDSRLVRPANFPGAAAGNGYTFVDVKGYRVLVMNVSGNAFMRETVDNPFTTVDKVLKNTEGEYDISVLDIHAEATSEKIAMGWYVDGRISAVFGTHTHVQTADARVLPRGTGYITDIGMCGSHNGVLGVKTESIIHSFTVHTPTRFEEAEGDEYATGVIFEIDTDTKKCVRCEGISF